MIVIRYWKGPSEMPSCAVTSPYSRARAARRCTIQAPPKNSAAATRWATMCCQRRSPGGTTRSSRSNTMCSPAIEVSGRAKKIVSSIAISVSSRPSVSEAWKNLRPITSTKVRHIITNRAIPETSASRFSNRFMDRTDHPMKADTGAPGARIRQELRLLERRDLLAEFVEDLLRVPQAFLLRHVDPGLLEARRPVLD